MTARIFLLLALVAGSAFAAANKTRTVSLRDWSISVPLDTKEEKTDGPDFSVTNFQFKKLNATLGIYEGGYPQEFSADAQGVTKKKEKIGGQDVVWSLWKERVEGTMFFRAEVFLTSAVTRIPGSNVSYEERFHVFIASFDEKAFVSVQDIVRTLKKKENSFRFEVRQK